jgi:hypothetical protein
MNKLKNLWDEIIYQLEDFQMWLGNHKPVIIKVKKITDTVILYAIPILLIIVLVGMAKPNVNNENLNVTYNITNAEVEQISTEVELGKAIREVIKTQCNLRKVDINLVYAIINSEEVEDEYRIGVMKLHPNLREKYDAQMGEGPGIIESIYSNAVAGIDRLAWCLKNNESLEGALMVYYYTKPEAQKMWAKGIKTTEWVDGIKEGLK